MVDDNEIKTKLSPFTVREGEIKVFDGKDGYVSINQIMTKINQGTINEIHFKILEIIDKYEFLTSRQIFFLLNIEGIKIGNQNRLNSRLEQLVKNKIITRYFFKSNEGEGVYRIYCLEKMGKYLLESREIDCNWQPTDNSKPVSLIKKKLASNQLAIAYLRKLNTVQNIIVKPELKAKDLGKIFKPSLKIVLKYGNENIEILYEAVRREEEWENNFLKRMKLFSDFYRNYKIGDCGIMMKPPLVLICEDEKHMAEVFRCLIVNKVDLNTKIYYTTDLEQNAENLNNSFFEFNLEDGKYKIRRLKSKILEKIK